MNSKDTGGGAKHQALIQKAVNEHQAGRLATAEAKYRRILKVEPDHPQILHLLGVIAFQTGRNQEAVDCITKAVAIKPDFAEAHGNLGVALQALGRSLDAADSFDAALAIQPDYAEALCNRGNALTDLGRYDDAVDSLQKALALNPDYAKALNNLGNAQRAMGDIKGAAENLQKALALNPDYAEAHSNLGAILYLQGRPEDAITAYRKAIAVNPNLAEAHCNLGNALNDLGRRDEAVESCRKAIALKPDFADAHNILGAVFRAAGRLDDALKSLLKALSLNPGNADALSNLGSVYQDLRQFDESLASFKQAMDAAPENSNIANNYLHTLLYIPGLSNQDLFETYRQVVAALRPIQETLRVSASAPAALPGEGERLRIGYLSSNFHDHPGGRVILPLIANHDHDQYEIFCYSEQTKQDAVTEQFRDAADHWRTLNGLPDKAVAEQIRDDGIHIMVYLSGHFDANRPMVAIDRPAPVQVAMHGGATSALDEMDYWLSDSILHPPSGTGDGEQFTEEVFRLPNFYIFPALENAPDVSPPPADDNGFVTFCSFNKPCKINDAVLDAWAEILLAVPDSRLMLKFKNHLEVASLRQAMLGRLEHGGVAAERITLVSALDTIHEHLAHYGQADIGLDTFPFAGATTTFQSLWMGVPVVSLMTERFIGRAGGSFSVHAGLAELVAETPKDYVEKAVALAGDLPRLKDLRQRLRRRVASSPLCDGPGYAANVEDAYRTMWRTHLSGG